MTAISPLSQSVIFMGQTVRGFLNRIDSPAVILLYHRVADLVRDPQLLAVNPDNFYQQIDFLKKNYSVLTVEEFHNILRQGKIFPKKSLLLTFDDGYADNLYQALPVLEKLNTQAVFFVATGNIGTPREFWWDDLERIFLTDAVLPPACSLAIRGHQYQFNTSEENKYLTYQRIHPILKPLKFAEREEALQKLYQWASLKEQGRETHRVMTEEEILKMSQSQSAVIGTHTDTHGTLSSLSYDEQLADIQKSQSRLERITGRPVEYFSYPFGGKADYNADSVKIVKQLKFKMVMGNYYGQVHRWTNAHQLPRILVRDWDLKTFKQEIKQFFHH